MYCRFCGTELPNDSNFCFKCGKALGQGVQAPEGKAWEYSQIEEQTWSAYAYGGLNYKTWFFAEAVGPRGKYSAGESRKLSYSRIDQVKDRLRADQEVTLQALVEKLIQDGWEKTPEQGEKWYQLRFRRRLP